MKEKLIMFFRQTSKDFKSGEPLLVGKSLTKSFGILILILAILPQHTTADGWQFRIIAFLLSPPNEIGDTFAGIAGVLAFLWIIVTVWLQSQELSEQREELKQTREEVKLAREAQEKQVIALEAHAKVFEDEKLFRDHSRAQKLFEQKLKTFRMLVSEKGHAVKWRRTAQQSQFTIISPVRNAFSFDKKLLDLSDDEFFYKQTTHVVKAIDAIIELHGSNDLVACPAQFILTPFLVLLAEIRETIDRLSEDQQERVRSIGFDRMEFTLDRSLASDIWEESDEDTQ